MEVGEKRQRAALKLVERKMTIIKSYTFKVSEAGLQNIIAKNAVGVCFNWDMHRLMFKFYFIDKSTYKNKKKGSSYTLYNIYTSYFLRLHLWLPTGQLPQSCIYLHIFAAFVALYCWLFGLSL